MEWGELEVVENPEELVRRGYAKTMNEWWFFVGHDWTNIQRLLQYCLSQKDMKKVYEAVESRESTKLYCLLEKAWHALPDKSWIHTIPGFGQLCDLCSDFPDQ